MKLYHVTQKYPIVLSHFPFSSLFMQIYLRTVKNTCCCTYLNLLSLTMSAEPELSGMGVQLSVS